MNSLRLAGKAKFKYVEQSICACELKIVCSIVPTVKCVRHYEARAFNCFMVTLIV